MRKTALCELAEKYRSDKCPALNHNYTPFYHELFKNRRNEVKKVLEIGIGYPETMPVNDYLIGASLYMWGKYFPEADIFGIDIREDTLIKDERIQTFKCDQSSPAQLTELIVMLGGDWDFICDDGSHKAEHQIISAITLVPFLKPKTGLYAIEDVREPSWVMAELEKKGIECELYNFNNHAVDDRIILIRAK